MHPEFSTFCGAVGSSLVVIAILRLVVTLVGDQPTLPTRFSGTKADLLRIGDSFARAGTAWPVALMVGTVLLVLPAYLGLQHHVRRWAPMLGLSLVTGLAAMLVGYLRIYSGRELKSASTLTLVSDALVGPIGLGALTIICIALAVQVTRRRQ